MRSLLLPVAFIFVAANSVADESLQNEARILVKAFVGTLKPLLSTTLQEKGPVAAIGVCAEKGPAIAAELSARSGWELRRVSLKPRNPELAMPDAWERQELERLAELAAAGGKGPSLNHGESVDARYRYLQAQSVEGVCLVCHGRNIDTAVAAAIREYYPKDSATGYQLGDIRGAISLLAPASDPGG